MTSRHHPVIPAVIVLVAAVVRFAALSNPDRIFFDETYYVNDARAYLDQGTETGFAVHPPLGKWLIAAGIAAFGDRPFGWRVTAALAGTIIVLLTYAIGQRLLGWRGAAALAGLLVALDGLMVVQSRIAMLDIFLAFFVVLGVWLLLVDADRAGLGGTGRRDRPRAPPGGPAVGGSLLRPYRLAAGAAFGLAVATKWSGVLALGAAGLVVVGWELASRRRESGRATTGLVDLGLSVAVALVVVPAAAYALTWAPWLAAYPHTHEGRKVCEVDGRALDPCEVGLGERIDGLARYHAGVWRFHRGLDADHPYRAPAWRWIWLGRPIVYYWESCPPERATPVPVTGEDGEVTTPDPCVVAEGNAAEIVALGNPALWWLGLAALVPLGLGLLARDPRAWLVFAFLGGQYLPWILVDRPAFFFYMTPVVPFIALTLAYAVVWLDEGRASRPGRTGLTAGTLAGAVVAALAVALFVYFYPVFAAVEIPYDAWRMRMWLGSWV